MDISTKIILTRLVRTSQYATNCRKRRLKEAQMVEEVFSISMYLYSGFPFFCFSLFFLSYSTLFSSSVFFRSFLWYFLFPFLLSDINMVMSPQVKNSEGKIFLTRISCGYNLRGVNIESLRITLPLWSTWRSLNFPNSS